MEEEFVSNVVDFTATEIINKFKSTLTQEVAIISDKDNNWSIKKTLEEKEKYYKLEISIITNIVNSAKELYEVVREKDRQDAPVAYKWLDDLISYFNIFDNRVDEYLKKENKITSKVKASEVEDYTKNIVFRNTVKNDQAKLKKIIKSINIGEDKQVEIEIRLHKKTPVIPLSLRPIAEAKYPSLNEYIERNRKILEELKK